MSLELTDLGRVKVHPEVHALLTAQASISECDTNALVRGILHDWATKQFHVISVANSIAISKGLSGITGDWK